ncbi:MAG: hypothetical protein ABH839_00285 [Chloroflexota bacterium]
MNTWLLWECLNEETRRKLRKLMPPGWKPPCRSGRAVELNCRLEGVGEIGRLMRQPRSRARQPR